MSFKLIDLQNVASEKGEHYFMEVSGNCLHSTLLALRDALLKVDVVDYADPLIIQATNAMAAGLGAGTGPCGVVSAGSIALSLKYGTSSIEDREKRRNAWLKSRDWYFWFKEQFLSCDCMDLSFGTDFADLEQRKRYFEGPRLHVCNAYLTRAIRKLVDMLTVENPDVIRDS
ncbi:C_GCAxxG_C_C family protein [Candidatus Bathyarchaeota archaeon]|nr:C_GCAxxG_C_C family protein [Candidatus Bathyarchaeota archaeon]